MNQDFLQTKKVESIGFLGESEWDVRVSFIDGTFIDVKEKAFIEEYNNGRVSEENKRTLCLILPFLGFKFKVL